MEKLRRMKCLSTVCLMLVVVSRCLSQECQYPCLNGGICTYTSTNETACNCTDEYYGDTCQYRDSCIIFNFCENNATCVRDGYRCECTDGYGGSRCQYPDACISSPCPGRARCENIWPDSYTCPCGDGYYGPECNLYNACRDEPCENDGDCIHQGSGTFMCECASNQTGYYGERCELYDECLKGGCKQNDACLEGHCDKTTSQCEQDETAERGYRCRCYPGFYGEDCSSYDSCLLRPCRNEASCETIEHSASYICHCAPGYEGAMCDIAALCPSDSTVSLKGLIEWPSTPVHEEVRLPCPTGGGIASRTCQLDEQYPKWTFPNSSECLDTELDPETAGIFTSQLACTTEGATDMEETELESAVDLLSAIAEFSYSNLSIAKDMMRCVSNVLDVDAEVMTRSSAGKDTSGSILSLMKGYGENAVLGNTSFVEFREANMQLQLVEPDSSEVTDGLEFAEEVENRTSLTISLPGEIFSAEKKSRVRFTLLQNAKLFPKISDSGNRFMVDPENEIIIGAEVTGRAVIGLKETVDYSLGITQHGEPYRCVHWEENGGFWTHDGLQTITMTVDNVTSVDCTSTHLTYFAVLLDTGFTNDLTPEHLLSLTIISYVGSIISMVGLLITFITYTIFRSLRKQPSGKLLVNLCASLFSLNLVFILDGTGAMTGTWFGCKVAAILLHYFVLTTFFWMGAEAISIYRALVEVFLGNRASYYVFKCAVFAWGGALIPVGLVLAIDHNLYTRHTEADICILSQDGLVVYYLLYLAPCTAVLLSNVVIFVLVLRAVFACNKQVHHNSGRLRRTQIGCALSITFLLGLTWLFGFFAISVASLPFQYVFCILNSMQGFFIFLFRCALYPEAVRSWKMCFKMRTLSVDRHINSSALQKHSSQRHPDAGSSSSRKSSKNKPNTKVTFDSGSESSKPSFRWLRRNEVNSNKGPYEERYRPTEMYDTGNNKDADATEYPFKMGFTDEHNV